MRRELTFFAYRYFVVPLEEQITLHQLTVENKNQLVVDLFTRIKEKKYSFSVKNRKYIIYYTKKITDKIHLYKFARETYRTLHQEGDKDLQPLEELDYPFIFLIVDFDKQIVLIQKKTTVFRNVETAKKRIEILINKEVEKFDYCILLEEITYEGVFWEYLEQASEIYELNLKLNSPNLFGAFIDAENFLRKINKYFNNTSTDIKLKNEKGRLKIIRKNIEGFIRYITGGGGEWELFGTFNGGSKRIRSKENIKTVNLPEDIDENENLKDMVIQSIEQLDHIMGENKNG